MDGKLLLLELLEATSVVELPGEELGTAPTFSISWPSLLVLMLVIVMRCCGKCSSLCGGWCGFEGIVVTLLSARITQDEEESEVKEAPAWGGCCKFVVEWLLWPPVEGD